jgi:hypothetical protein
MYPIDELQEDTVATINLGGLETQCTKCSAYMFAAEVVRTPKPHFMLCCSDGKMSWLPRVRSVPQLLHDLLTGSHPLSTHFRSLIRTYNSVLGFTSFGAKTCDPSELGASHGPPVCIVHGQVYHYAHTLFPDKKKENAKYAQLYMFDSSEANAIRCRRNPQLDPDLLDELVAAMDALGNPYTHAYARIKSILEDRKELHETYGASALPQITLGFASSRDGDMRRYNAPAAEEVAVCFESADGAPPAARDIVVYPLRAPAVRLPEGNDHLDPLTYPLLFPNGDPGWAYDLPHQGRVTAVRNTATCGEFYKMRLAIRDLSPSAMPHAGGLLFQQYLCDAYCRMEAQTLHFLRLHQNQLRADTYQNVSKYVQMTRSLLPRAQGLPPVGEGALLDPGPCGAPVVLPCSFKGSPRQLQQNFQDAMTIVRKIGRPDYFITFTANPQWPEVRKALEQCGQRDPSSRPDLVARIFLLRLKALLADLTDCKSVASVGTSSRNVLGKVLGFTWVVEFQKRGLPHAHILLIVDKEDRPSTSSHVDARVCAELPSEATHPRLRAIVLRTMIHGPCGYLAPKAPCCAGGTCDKKYPREFQPVTEMQDNGYPLYRRRDTALRNVGNKGHSLVDDRWVVPYNPYLLLRHDAHINVEITAGVRFVKYMYKYTYKGHDRARLEVGGQGTSHTAVDEIRAFVDARYVGPCEAAWRLLQFPLSGMSHSVVRLDVHLPDEQRMLFRAGEEAAAMEKPAARRSMLTAWFTYNAAWTQHRDLLYSDFPSVCRYDRPTGTWVARSPWHLSASGERVLTRLQTATPVENERFYLYLLLLNVRGAASYEDLRTDDEGIVHPTFRACCLARQLVDGDAEHQLALEDAASLQSAAALRLLFAVMLLYCEVADPPHLWERFKVPFTEDFRRESKSDTLAEELALEHLETILAGEGKRNADFNLPSSGLASETDWARRALMEARCFDPDKERAASTTAYDRMNPEQALALVDGHSGTRSTPSMPLSSASFSPC